MSPADRIVPQDVQYITICGEAAVHMSTACTVLPVSEEVGRPCITKVDVPCRLSRGEAARKRSDDLGNEADLLALAALSPCLAVGTGRDASSGLLFPSRVAAAMVFASTL